jgi:uncharacterized phosphosugar-binding protein
MAATAARQYLDHAQAALASVASTQLEAIASAATLLADAFEAGRTAYAFGASHSFVLAEELVYRTGGLLLVNPIYPHGMNLSVRPMTMTSKLERIEGLGRELLAGSAAQEGDVLIVASTSGRNAVAIDMALEARERRVRTIGITSLAYTQGVTSRHTSGLKLVDLCDVVLDNGAPLGDACVEVAGFAQRVGPLSTVLGCAVVNAVAAEVAAELVRRGIEPPVFMSANLDAGDAYNARLLAANRARIHYM